MNIIPLSELNKYNYSINAANSLRQTRYHLSHFSCIGAPKKCCLLLYLDGCLGEYTMKDGTKYKASDKDVVYVPTGSEYRVNFYDFKSDDAGTVGVNFTLADESGAPFILSDTIEIVSRTDARSIASYIDKNGSTLPRNYARMKSGIYELLSRMSDCRLKKINRRFSVIEAGIREIEDINSDLSIADIAKLCNVSEIYFRKLFKEYSGLSPMQYMMRARIEKARDYLEHTDDDVAHIGELLGFADVSYFCRQFKKHTGLTPHKYRVVNN